MKQLAVFALAAMLLSVYACAAEDNAQTTATTATTAPAEQKAAPATTTPDPKTMTRKEAVENDKLNVVAAREEIEKAAKEAAPTEAPAAGTRSLKDPALIALGDEMFKAGRDYIVLTPAQRTSSAPEKVEIAEVFMYQCPHCFSFEPFVDNLISEQPSEVSFVRVPAIFNPIAELHAKAFYAANALGIWEQLHTPFFREIHTNRNLMRTEDKLLDFVESQGIERTAFASALRSFEVDSKVRDAKDLNSRYRIDSVPTMVINGKYVTSTSLVQSTAKLKQVINYLVSKEGSTL